MRTLINGLNSVINGFNDNNEFLFGKVFLLTVIPVKKILVNRFNFKFWAFENPYYIKIVLRHAKLNVRV